MSAAGLALRTRPGSTAPGRGSRPFPCRRWASGPRVPARTAVPPPCHGPTSRLLTDAAPGPCCGHTTYLSYSCLLGRLCRHHWPQPKSKHSTVASAQAAAQLGAGGPPPLAECPECPVLRWGWGALPPAPLPQTRHPQPCLPPPTPSPGLSLRSLSSADTADLMLLTCPGSAVLFPLLWLTPTLCPPCQAQPTCTHAPRPYVTRPMSTPHKDA